MLGGQPAKKGVTFKNSANAKNTTRKNATPTLTDNVPKKLMPGEGVLIDVQRILDKNPKPYFLKVGTFRIYGKDPRDVVVQTGKLHPKTLTTGDLHVKTIKKGTLVPKKSDKDSENSSKNSPKQLQLKNSEKNSEKKAPAKYSTRNSNTGNKKAVAPANAAPNSPGIDDPYAVLGVPRNATADAISSAYRKKIITAHPDKGGSNEEAAAVNLAYGILNNAGKKKIYDKYGMKGVKDAGLAGGARRKLASRKKFKR